MKTRPAIFENIMDMGCYPGTFLRVPGELMPGKHLAGAGLGLTEGFKKNLPDVQFYDCNFDPDLYFDNYLSIPHELPVETAPLNPIRNMFAPK